MTITIGQRICELRKNHGYSQEYVAEQLGVSRQAVSKWETDTSAPDTYNLIGLAQLFGVSVEYIAIGKKEETPHMSPPGDAGNPVTVNRNHRQSLGLSNILGIIFLISGLLCGILSIIFDDRLLPVSLAAFVCAVFSFIQVKHKSVIAWWGYWVFDFLLGVFGMTSSPFLVFNPACYQGGLSISLIFGYLTWIWLVCNIIYTVCYVKRIKKQKQQT